MENSQRISAVIAYIPVIGWLYVFFAQRKNELAVFHLRQAIGLVIGVVVSMLVWVAASWVLAWIPFGDVFGVALFTLVLAIWIVAVIVLIVGMVNAARGRITPLPFFGGFANWIQM